jgi:uncharacterized DUF497 family protein
MKFTWDGKKRRANILNHGFDFVDAKEVFEGVTFTLGFLKGTVVVIAHTENGDEIHVISMRKATKHEQKIYFEGLTD